MQVGNTCDFCARLLSDLNLIETIIKVTIDFDATGCEVRIEKHGRWCNKECIRAHVCFMTREAIRERQRKRDHAEDEVRILRQRIRDDHARTLWELQRSKELRVVRALKSLGFFVSRLVYRPLRMRYYRSLASWKSIDS